MARCAQRQSGRRGCCAGGAWRAHRGLDERDPGRARGSQGRTEGGGLRHDRRGHVRLGQGGRAV
eukprot:11726740-Heterocapsa_arctica.AAC.1